MVRCINYTIQMNPNGILYLLILLLELSFLVLISLYLISLIYSWFKGAPYVLSSQENINKILKHTKFKKNQKLLELGCGNGRFLRSAAKLYNISGIGVDINLYAIAIARLISKLQKIKSLEFKLQDIRQTDFSKADCIYIFLFPKLIDKIKFKLLNEVKKNVLIVSHGFKIEFLNKYLIDTLDTKTFKTYFYRVSKKLTK